MFYAASEIVFWILLSTIIGGGIGYGMSQARSIQIGKRLSESRADAPMERELAIAWDTIEDLNRRLQVAHETIRSSASVVIDEADELLFPAETEVNGAGAELPDSLEEAVAEDPEPEDIPEDTLPEDAAADDAEADESEDDSLIPLDRDPELAAPLVHTGERPVSTDEIEDDPNEPADGVVGSRLADRVASASIGNQVEVVKTVEF
ncbi:hypothetical protein ACFLRH_01015 [Actinomycetota bacterium]